MKENKELKEQLKISEEKSKAEKEENIKEINKLKDEMKQLLRNTCVTGTHNRKSPIKSTYTQISFHQNKDDSKIIINKNSSILQFKINPKNSDNNSFINNESSDNMLLKNLDENTNFDTTLSSFNQNNSSLIDIGTSNIKTSTINNDVKNISNNNIINTSNIFNTSITTNSTNINENSNQNTSANNKSSKPRYSYINQAPAFPNPYPKNYDNDFNDETSLPRLSINNQVKTFININNNLLFNYLFNFF